MLGSRLVPKKRRQLLATGLLRKQGLEQERSPTLQSIKDSGSKICSVWLELRGNVQHNCSLKAARGMPRSLPGRELQQSMHEVVLAVATPRWLLLKSKPSFACTLTRIWSPQQSWGLVDRLASGNRSPSQSLEGLGQRLHLAANKFTRAAEDSGWGRGQEQEQVPQTDGKGP